KALAAAAAILIDDDLRYPVPAVVSSPRAFSGAAKASKEMSMSAEIKSAEIKPYRISVGDDVLADLKSRLRNTRWPESELVDDWSQGAPLKWIKDICRYWADEYDWRSREARLNRFAQFTTGIDGLGIHFLHVRSPQANAMP